jgi:hypothetical protein
MLLCGLQLSRTDTCLLVRFMHTSLTWLSFFDNIVSALGFSISDSSSGIHDIFNLPSNRSHLLESRKRKAKGLDTKLQRSVDHQDRPMVGLTLCFIESNRPVRYGSVRYVPLRNRVSCTFHHTARCGTACMQSAERAPQHMIDASMRQCKSVSG